MSSTAPNKYPASTGDKTKKSDDSTAQKETQKPAAPLEEDDEFEDFPIEGM